jgi:hypothetical protein
MNEIVDDMRKLRAPSAMNAGRFQTEQSALMAELLVLLAEEQAKSAQTLERYTRSLVRLTWALVWLAVGLLVFTISTAIVHLCLSGLLTKSSFWRFWH